LKNRGLGENSKPIREERERLLMPQKKQEDKECYIIPSPHLRTRPFVIMGEKMSPEEMDRYLGVTKEVKPSVKTESNEVVVTQVKNVKSESDEVVVTQVKKTPVKTKNEVVVNQLKQTPVEMKSEVVTEVKLTPFKKGSKVSDSAMKRKIHNPYLKSPKSGVKNPYQKAKVIDLSFEEQRIVKLKQNCLPVNTPYPFGEQSNKKTKQNSNSIFSTGGHVFNNCVFNF
jgi:hypothetical protein